MGGFWALPGNAGVSSQAMSEQSIKIKIKSFVITVKS